MAFTNPVFNAAVYQAGTKLGGPGDSATAVTGATLTTLTNLGAIVEAGSVPTDSTLETPIMTLTAEGDFEAQHVPPPVLVSATGAATGGSLAAGTFYYVVTAVTANGESNPSNEVAATVGGTSIGSAALVWSAITSLNTVYGQSVTVPSLTYNLYRGTVAGAESVRVRTGLTSAGTFTDTGVTTGTGYSGSQMPPVFNGATLPGDVVNL